MTASANEVVVPSSLFSPETGRMFIIKHWATIEGYQEFRGGGVSPAGCRSILLSIKDRDHVPWPAGASTPNAMKVKRTRPSALVTSIRNSLPSHATSGRSRRYSPACRAAIMRASDKFSNSIPLSSGSTIAPARLKKYRSIPFYAKQTRAFQSLAVRIANSLSANNVCDLVVSRTADIFRRER